MSVRSHFPASLASLLMLACGNALAVCTPIAHYLYVGSGPNCNYSTIQAAIDNVVCPATSVVVSVANSETYDGQHLTIQNKSLAVVGTGEACASPPPICDPNLGCIGSPPAQIAVTGDGANSVFTVGGSSNVTIANLSISGGVGAPNFLSGGGGIGFNSSGGALTLNNVSLHHNSGGNGGGVAIYGDGSVYLDGVSIHDNYASSSGGGVSAFSSFSGQIQLVIVDDPAQSTEIKFNHAMNSGGGMYAAGNTHLLAVAKAPGRASIHDNLAGDPATNLLGDGGGIQYEGTAFADIGLPGNSIYANRADLGAGVSVGASSSGNAVLRLFSTDPTNPTGIANNISRAYGGALHVGGAGGGVHATACMFDASLSGNSAAQSGAAIHVADGGHLFINPDANAECDYSAVSAFGAKHCDAANINCNSIALNQALFGTSPTDAATIDFTGAAQIAAQRLRLSGNSGGYAVRGQVLAGASVAFTQCLIDHNSVSAQLVNLQGASMSFDGCTFADDSIGATPVFAFDTGLTLTRSIVHETVSVLSPAATGLTAQYLIFNDPKLPTGNTVFYVDPGFVNAANGDYHLQATSPAIDFAPTGAEPSGGDFDRQPREVDLPGTNLFGARDLGPYESQVDGVMDRIFMGAFET